MKSDGLEMVIASGMIKVKLPYYLLDLLNYLADNRGYVSLAILGYIPLLILQIMFLWLWLRGSIQRHLTVLLAIVAFALLTSLPSHIGYASNHLIDVYVEFYEWPPRNLIFGAYICVVLYSPFIVLAVVKLWESSSYIALRKLQLTVGMMFVSFLLVGCEYL